EIRKIQHTRDTQLLRAIFLAAPGRLSDSQSALRGLLPFYMRRLTSESASWTVGDTTVVYLSRLPFPTRHEVECKLQTVDRALTKFLQAEGIQIIQSASTREAP